MKPAEAMSKYAEIQQCVVWYSSVYTNKNAQITDIQYDYITNCNIRMYILHYVLMRQCHTEDKSHIMHTVHWAYNDMGWS